MAFFEEQKVCLDAGIWIEDTVRQADDRVQVALRHQLLLAARLDAFAKERAIWQDDGGAAAIFQKLDNQQQKKVRSLTCLERLGHVLLDAICLHVAVGWVGDDEIDIYPPLVIIRGG